MESEEGSTGGARTRNDGRKWVASVCGLEGREEVRGGGERGVWFLPRTVSTKATRGVELLGYRLFSLHHYIGQSTQIGKEGNE